MIFTLLYLYCLKTIFRTSEKFHKTAEFYEKIKSSLKERLVNFRNSNPVIQEGFLKFFSEWLKSHEALALYQPQNWFEEYLRNIFAKAFSPQVAEFLVTEFRTRYDEYKDSAREIVEREFKFSTADDRNQSLTSISNDVVEILYNLIPTFDRYLSAVQNEDRLRATQRVLRRFFESYLSDLPFQLETINLEFVSINRSLAVSDLHNPDTNRESSSVNSSYEIREKLWSLQQAEQFLEDSISQMGHLPEEALTNAILGKLMKENTIILGETDEKLKEKLKEFLLHECESLADRECWGKCDKDLVAQVVERIVDRILVKVENTRTQYATEISYLEKLGNDECSVDIQLRGTQ
ncbi:MAG: hypothetical protein N2654_03435 [Deltaproteobacteria bacterium]|nr:hypothetical protein [Deltaproteobacteria bacterium]